MNLDDDTARYHRAVRRDTGLALAFWVLGLAAVYKALQWWAHR